MSHLTEGELNATLDGALEGRELDRVESHLAGCDQCHSALAALEASDRALARVLDHDPGEEYFATFGDRVEKRLRDEGLAGAFARPIERRSGWFGRPSGFALAGAAAATIVGAGLVFIIAREIESPSMRRPDVAKHLATPAPGAAQEPEAGAAPSASAEAVKEQKLASAAAAKRAEADRMSPKEKGANAPTGTAPAASSTALQALKSNGAAAADNARRAEAARLREGASSTSAPTAGQAAPSLAKAAPLAATSNPNRDLEARAPQAADRLDRAVTPARDARESARPAPMPSSANGFAPAPRGGVTPGSVGSVSPAPSQLTPGAMTPLASRSAPPLPQPHGAVNPTSPAPPKNESATPGAASAPAAKVDDARTAKKSMVLDEQADNGTGELCGRVLDTAGHGVASAAVTIAETGASSHTDAAGHFCVRATSGDRTVLVMAVGYEEVRRPVLVAASNPEMAVVMRPVDVLGARGGSGASGTVGLRAPSLRTGDSPAPQAPGAGANPGAGSNPAGAQWASPAQKSLSSNLAAPPPLDVAALQLATLNREAERLTAEATREPSAARYEAAAVAWERVVARVEGRPAEVNVRNRVARYRYLAWEAEPTRTRSVAAHAALTAYVLRAPMGADRDQATRWLERVKP